MYLFNIFTSLSTKFNYLWSVHSIVLNIVIAILISLISFICFFTFVWLFTWIRYSRFKINNSVNLTGASMAKIYLEKYGVNPKRIKFQGTFNGEIKNIAVESKVIYLNGCVVNDGNLMLRLSPLVYQSYSIYGLTKSLERAWSISSLNPSRLKTFWFVVSRKVTIIFILLPLVWLGLFLFKKYSGDIDSNIIYNFWWNFLAVVLLIWIIIFSVSQVKFYSKARKEIVENIKPFLNQREIKAVNFILKVKLAYYLLRTIFGFFRLILQTILLITKIKKH